MNSIEEARITNYLRNNMRYGPLQCRAIVRCMRDQAGAAGHGLDERFSWAGLGAGPEARAASAIVKLSLGAGGSETSERTIQTQIDRWLRMCGV